MTQPVISRNAHGATGRANRCSFLKDTVIGSITKAPAKSPTPNGPDEQVIYCESLAA